MLNRTALAGALTLVVLAAPGRAASATSGTVTMEETTFKVVDAFAWEEPEQEWTPDKKVIHAWLADHPLDHKALVAAKDLRVEMKRQGNKDVVVVELEFSPAGEWKGGTYKIAHQMCGIDCMSGAAKKATTKVTGDALTGAIHSKANDYEDPMGPAIDLTLDARVERKLTTPAAQAVQ
jgi:hypothetical protein